MLSVCFQEIKAEYDALFKITELIHIKKKAITCCPKLWLYLLNQVVMVADNSCQRVSALNRGGSMLRLQVIEFFGRYKLPMQQYTELKATHFRRLLFLFLLWNFNQGAKINPFKK